MQINNDSSLTLVYSNSIFSYNLADEIIQIPDTTIEQSLTLDSLKLEDKTQAESISLGEIANNIGFPVGTFINNNNGNNLILPGFPNALSNSTFPFDGTQFFETATFKEGYMDLKADNGLPLDIANLSFELKNKVSQTVIAAYTFDTIPAGSSDSVTFDLAGKTVDGQMEVNVINMDILGSGTDSVLIDTTDALVITITVRDLVVDSATAIFPAQDIINFKSNSPYKMGGPEFTSMTIRTGILQVNITSTIEDTLKFKYVLPGTIDSLGDSLVVISKVPPAPPGGSSSISETYKVNHLQMDLTGKDHDTVNTFYNYIKARIDSTGRLVHLSLDDSVIVFYGLLDIVPEYVEGYMGQHRVTIGPEKTSLDLFKAVKGGTLDLEQVDIGMAIDNGIGISGGFIINQLQTINSNTGTTVTLDGSIPGDLIIIDPATDDPFTRTTTFIDMNSSNSNAEELIENFSDIFNYYLDFFINIDGNKNNYGDFAYWDRGLEVFLNVEMPLSFIANNLILTDTIDFSYEKKEEPIITTGTITLIVDNSFPLDADLQLLLYDESFNFLDSLFVNTEVAAGDLDDNCIVQNSNRSKLEIAIGEERLDIFDEAKKAILWVSFNNTAEKCNGKYLKIYSRYGMQIHLTGNFIYGVGEARK